MTRAVWHRVGVDLGLGLSLLLAVASCTVEIDRGSRSNRDATATDAPAAPAVSSNSPAAAPAKVPLSLVAGERLEVSGLPVLRLSGTPREMGFQHGRALAAGIKEGFVRFVLEYRCHSVRARYDTILKRVESEIELPDRTRAELEGMVEGMQASGIDLALPMLKRDLGLGELIVLNTIDHWGIFGCSGLTAWGRATTDGEVLCSRNFDFDIDRERKAIARLGIVLVYEPDDGHRFASFGFPGMAGVVTGISEAGVGVFLHVGNGGFGGGEEGLSLPPTVIARTLLEECSTADAAPRARELLAGACIRNSFLFRVVTSGKDAPPTTVFEIDPRGLEEQRLPDEKAGQPPILVTTNHYLTRAAAFAVIPDSQVRWWNLDKSSQKCLLEGDRVIDPVEAWSGLGAVKAQSAILTLHSLVWKPATQEVWAAFCEIDERGRARAASTLPPSAVKLADLFEK